MAFRFETANERWSEYKNRLSEYLSPEERGMRQIRPGVYEYVNTHASEEASDHLFDIRQRLVEIANNSSGQLPGELADSLEALVEEIKEAQARDASNAGWFVG